MHFVALLASVLNALAMLYKLAIICSILISLFYYVKTMNQCFFIRYGALSGWEIAYSENLYYPIKILPSTVITSYLIVLHFAFTTKQNKKKRTALICKDALIADEYRSLKVELKISGLSKDDA
jgi:hypothetical protein